MKPLTLNLSKMVKIGGDKNSTVFQHEAGHQIKIAHSALSSVQRKQIEKLHTSDLHEKPVSEIEKFEDGGVATKDDRSPASVNENPDSFGSKYFPEDAEGNPVERSKPLSDMLFPKDVEGKPISRAEDAGQNADYINKPLPGEKISSDISEPPPAESAQGAPANTLKDQQQSITQPTYEGQSQLDKELSANNNRINDIANRQKQASNEFQDEMRNKNIDPKRLFKNQDTFSKIMSGFAMLAGGMSSGTLGGENPAVKMINENINRDIDAQKNDQSKTMNMYKMHRDALGDEQLAQMQLRNNMLMGAKVKMEEDQGLLPGSVADLRKKATIGQLNNDIALTDQSIIARKAALSGGSNMSAIDLSRAGLIPAAQADKEQASIDRQQQAIKSANELYEKMNAEQSPENLLNPQSHERMKALKADLVNTIMNVSPSKRLTKESVEEEIDPLLINNRDTDETRKEKLNSVLNAIQKHADETPYMRRYAPGSLPRYDQQQSAAIQPVPRLTKDGRVALYDPKTKAFVGYKQ